MMSLSLNAEWYTSYSCDDRVTYIAGRKITLSRCFKNIFLMTMMDI